MFDPANDKPKKIQTKISLINPDASMLQDMSRQFGNQSQHDVMNMNRLDKSASPSSSFVMMQRKQTMKEELGSLILEPTPVAGQQDEIVELDGSQIIMGNSFQPNDMVDEFV